MLRNSRIARPWIEVDREARPQAGIDALLQHAPSAGGAGGTGPEGQSRRRRNPQIAQVATPVAGSRSRKLAQPLVRQ